MGNMCHRALPNAETDYKETIGSEKGHNLKKSK